MLQRIKKKQIRDITHMLFLCIFKYELEDLQKNIFN